ncbi:hypothetical protein [Dyella ginsengisoli]|uniref:hypothetical protein n=1 Tax=Dyella ginsengisoli TaxID=363848 RepID=UPI0012FDD8C5|nr:hypothetical protein [Dyella ginsengisoli]
MQDIVRRYFKIFIGVIGALSSGAVIVSGLKSGYVPGFSRAALVTGTTYHGASQASQFWFIIFFWSVACVGFVWLAWSAYRD